jgi:nicotinamide mononucleotide (NMN) deamidase PncC
MWKETLKEAGVNIHIIATGAGAGLQQRLWEVPGSSAYLSGCSFPYSAEEQEELLGFMPEHFCSEEAAIDLASAAYMKAYKFGGKKPIGVGLTASVASEVEHRGDHRVFICVMTDERTMLFEHTFEKGVGQFKRHEDGERCDTWGFWMLIETAKIFDSTSILDKAKDVTDQARERFFLRPFFTANGKRLDKLPKEGRYALMPGAFNPPHEGHYGAATAAMTDYNYKAVFEITANPPHKDALKVQELLQRAKLLLGQDRLFTQDLPLYLDKARKYSKRPFILGADAMVRMLDPKWGLDVNEMFNAFYDLSTKLFVAGREVNGVMTTCDDILKDIKANHPFKVWATAQVVMKPLEGEWNISSTELRNKKI